MEYQKIKKNVISHQMGLLKKIMDLQKGHDLCHTLHHEHTHTHTPYYSHIQWLQIDLTVHSDGGSGAKKERKQENSHIKQTNDWN